MKAASLLHRGLVLLLGLAMLPEVAVSEIRRRPADECLRPDTEKITEVMRDKMAAGQKIEEAELKFYKKVSGCVPYQVNFVSTLTKVAAGVTTTITGRGTIVILLASDPGKPDYTLTSGPEDPSVAMAWSGVTMSGGACSYTITSAPATPFSFWLGLKAGAGGTVDLVVTPSDNDMHQVKIKCPQGSGPTMPTAIFSAAWVGLHGEGETVAPPPTAAAVNLDMAALALQFKDRQPSPEELKALMRKMVPDADAQIAAARDNFMISMQASSGARVAHHTINRTVPLGFNQGTVHEQTVIEVVRVGSQ
jgi:hypothetical protein